MEGALCPRAARTYGAFARGYDCGAATQLGAPTARRSRCHGVGAAWRGAMLWLGAPTARRSRYEFATTMWRSLDKSRAPEQKFSPMLPAVILFLPTMSMFGCCRFGFGLAGAAAALVGILEMAVLVLDKVPFRHLPPGGRNPGALCLSDIMHPATHGMPFRHFALRA